ncbi:hypothetical protein [Pseudonocardia xishanensis]|uniref:Uncharacterized protein n=1 Tax=Pseudonocardia xishanensis TaxID=630995 RepID=A0ABP8RZ92_9PSEU
MYELVTEVRQDVRAPATHTDQRFDAVDQRFDGIEATLRVILERLPPTG